MGKCRPPSCLIAFGKMHVHVSAICVFLFLCHPLLTIAWIAGVIRVLLWMQIGDGLRQLLPFDQRATGTFLATERAPLVGSGTTFWLTSWSRLEVRNRWQLLHKNEMTLLELQEREKIKLIVESKEDKPNSWKQRTRVWEGGWYIYYRVEIVAPQTGTEVWPYFLDYRSRPMMASSVSSPHTWTSKDASSILYRAIASSSSQSPADGRSYTKIR